MKFLILNIDYPDFLRWLYTQDPGLEKQPYEDQMRARVGSLFGVADFYSSNLRKLGHEAWDIQANNEFMQKAWAREHSIRVGGRTLAAARARTILQRAWRVVAKTPISHFKPFFRRVLRSLGIHRTWFYDILAAQIKHYKPDILLNLAMAGISSRFLREMKPYTRLLMGQIASPLPADRDFHVYDLVISSLPNFVEHFRNLDVPSELLRWAFGPVVLSKLKHRSRDIPVSFVGSLFTAHQSRVRLLEHVSSHLEIGIWGTGVDRLSENSPIRLGYNGTAWGIEMYQILHRSKMTLNYHIDVADCYANNMRLFEATGVGTLLITDWKENLHEMFEPGKEVVAYRTPEECVELIEYYLEHDDEREAIAAAGQQRTLRDHTYVRRLEQLTEIILETLGKSGDQRALQRHTGASS